MPVQLDRKPLDCRVGAGVSLDDAGARGIQMSRLYLALEGVDRRG